MSGAQPTDVSILVVDDEPMVTGALVSLLEMETEWSVVAFNRADEAVASLKQQWYHAVLTDFVMPGLDGIELLDRVRDAQPFTSRLLLTGYADKKSAIRSINEVGLYQYLEKPWDNQELLIVLRNAVERAHLLLQLDEKMRRLSDRDRSLRELRDGLRKALI